MKTLLLVRDMALVAAVEGRCAVKRIARAWDGLIYGRKA